MSKPVEFVPLETWPRGSSLLGYRADATAFDLENLADERMDTALRLLNLLACYVDFDGCDKTEISGSIHAVNLLMIDAHALQYAVRMRLKERRQGDEQ